MWTTVHLVSTIIVGGCFVLSGTAKLRDRESTPQTFQALGVPAAFNHRWAYALYPWAELLVGIGVLVAPAWAWWPSAGAAFVLLAVLVALVARVIRRGDAASCNCFGSTQPITDRTLLRNVIFLALAGSTLVAPPTSPSPLWALAGQPELIVAAALSAALACLLTALSTGAQQEEPAEERLTDPVLPDLALENAEGTPVALDTLIAGGPALLVHVKEGCSSCREVSAFFHDRPRIADRVVVHLIERLPHPDSTRSAGRLWDLEGEVMTTLGMRATPSALLVAADGSIPANPVYGTKKILELVAGIEEAVRATTPPPIGEVLDR